MTESEVAVLLGLNKSNFPYAYRDMSKAEGGALLKSWHQSLAKFPAEIIFAAYNQALSFCKNPVTIADIYTALRKIKAATSTPVEAMWREAIKAARRAAANTYYYGFSAESSKFPGKTQGYEYRQATNDLFDHLPHITRLWFGSPREMERIGAIEPDELETVIFPRFRRFVEEQRDREDTIMSTPDNLLEYMQSKPQLKEDNLCHTTF